MSETVTYKPFGELLKNVVDNRGRSCPTADSGIPLIATNCIKNENLYPVFEKVRYVSQEIFDSWFRGHPKPGDIIFVNKGTPGRVCWVPNPLNFCIAQDMVAIRADEKKIYPKYLFAALRSPNIQGEIENLHVGSLIPHFKKSDFNDLKIPLPDDASQKFIGDLYFKLSLKIDLLQRQIQTIENLSETIFRQWMIDNKENCSEQIFGELIETTLGGEWGKENIEGEYKKQVCCIRGTDIADLQNGLAERTPVRFVKEKKFESIQPLDGDLILEISGGTDDQSTGRTIYIDELNRLLFPYPLIFSNFCRLIRPKKREYSYFLYLYIQYLYKQDEFFNLENGSSGIKNLDYKYLLFELRFILPNDKNEIEKFHKAISAYFKKINRNKQQIKTLQLLRNSLLPKLMSGEVKVYLNGKKA